MKGNRSSNGTFHYLLVCLLGIGCSDAASDPLNVDPGSVSDNTYRNSGLGFSLTAPPEWVFWESTDSNVGNEEHASALSPYDPTSHMPLFVMIPGSIQHRGGMIAGTVVDPAAIDRVETPLDYLELLKREVRRSSGRQNSTFGQIKSGELAGKKFVAMRVSIDTSDTTYHTYAYVSKVEDFLLVVSITYSRTSEFSEAQGILQGLRFEH